MAAGMNMRCPKCGVEAAPGKRFCADCGAPLPIRCPKCGAEAQVGKPFCADCGTRLEAASLAPAGKPAPPPSGVRVAAEAAEIPEGERKTVTALFADIKGSTELMRDLDPEEARAIVDPALKLMMEAVHRYDGYVAQSTGDGIFALFGAPVAHEDHPQRALHAALAMQEELHRYADRLRADGKIPVEARVGVNTGEVVVRSIETGGHTEYTPIGHVTNLASRMQTAAPTGSIAASEATQRLCEGYFEFRALGPTAVKGVNAPIEVYEVVRAGPLRTHFQLSARRGLTEVRRARARDGGDAARARNRRTRRPRANRRGDGRSGHRQVAAVVRVQGDVSQSGWMVLETFSVSHGKASAYLPVLDLLHGYFEIAGEDDARTRREKVAGKIRGSRPGTGGRVAISVRSARDRRGRRSAGADGRADRRSGARWKRSSGSCCASRSISR